MNCKHELRAIDSAIIYIGNKMRMIDSYQCIHCQKWYFKDRKADKRIDFDDKYKGDEVEKDFEYK